MINDTVTGKHIDAIMAPTKYLPKHTEDGVTKIINMISTTERAHQNLVRYGFEKKINNSTIISIIE